MRDNEILKLSLGAGPDCPSIEILSERLEFPAEDPVRRAAEIHISECIHCRTELDLLHEFESGIIQPDEADAVRWISARLKKNSVAALPATSRRHWWSPQILAWSGAVAAVAVLAVGLTTQWNAGRPGIGPVPEYANESLRARSIEVIDTPGAFEWKPVGADVRYELTVRLVDGTRIFYNILTKPVLAYPAEVVTTIKSGKLLLWEVVAKDASGNEIARSGVQRIQHQSEPDKGR